MKTALVLAFSNLKHDARVMRQVNFLSKRFNLTIVCYGMEEDPRFNLIKVPGLKLTSFTRALLAILLLSRRHSWAYQVLYPFGRSLKQKLGESTFDLIVANDVETLPLAFSLKTSGTKITFDAHEYAPLHFEDRLWWRLFFQPFNTFLCKKYIPLVDGMTTIGQGLADKYQKHFGKKPIVITNACTYHNQTPIASDSEIIRLVHIGIVNRSRKLEMFIELANALPDNFTLDLILVIPPQASPQTGTYFDQLRDLAKSNPRVTFRDAFPARELVLNIRSYDMGIILAPPINFNYANGLPNKLFDYIQARIAVASWPTPEIANIVNKYSIGIISDAFTLASLVASLKAVKRTDITKFKQNTELAASDLSAEKNESILNEMLDTMFT